MVCTKYVQAKASVAAPLMHCGCSEHRRETNEYAQLTPCRRCAWIEGVGSVANDYSFFGGESAMGIGIGAVMSFVFVFIAPQNDFYLILFTLDACVAWFNFSSRDPMHSEFFINSQMITPKSFFIPHKMRFIFLFAYALRLSALMQVPRLLCHLNVCQRPPQSQITELPTRILNGRHKFQHLLKIN